MSANVEHMAYRYADRDDVPWHRLGTPIDRNEQITTLEFQQRAGANWPVMKRPVKYNTEGTVNYNPLRTDPRHFVLTRGDSYAPLSIVGTQYKPVQNATVFEFFKEFCDAGEMTLETGGVLDEGRTIWCLAQLREGFELSGGDRITGHLLFSNSHDGNAGHIKFTTIRVVCANTLTMALSGGSSYRIHHRSVFDAELAKQSLGLATEQLHLFQQQAGFLSKQRMDGEAFKRFLHKLMPPKEVETTHGNPTTDIIYPRMYTYAVEALASQPGRDMSPGTWWQGFNAITYMLDHNKSRISDDASRLNNVWFGAGAQLKQKALTTALEMAR